MAEVSVMIDGRSYSVACDDGEERRLQQLSAFVDQRMREVGVAGTSNKAQAMVLSALVLADEIFDLNEKLSAENRSSVQTQESTVTHIEYHGLSPNDEQNVVSLIGQMAAKVEKLTSRVQKKAAG